MLSTPAMEGTASDSITAALTVTARWRSDMRHSFESGGSRPKTADKSASSDRGTKLGSVCDTIEAAS